MNRIFVERSDKVLRNLLCPPESMYGRSHNQDLRIDLESFLMHNGAAFDEGALGEVAFHRGL